MKPSLTFAILALSLIQVCSAQNSGNCSSRGRISISEKEAGSDSASTKQLTNYSGEGISIYQSEIFAPGIISEAGYRLHSRPKHTLK